MNCLEYFYSLLSRRDYSAKELLKKGQEKEFNESEITDALTELQFKGDQSDSRFVEMMISSYQGKYGKSAIKRKCLEKGITTDVFEQIWGEQSENSETGELGALKVKVMRKYKIEYFKNIEPKTKAKLLNYLKYRGFNPFEVLNQWQREEDGD